MEEMAVECGEKGNKLFSVKSETKPEQDDSGFDTCDSSDERKHRLLISANNDLKSNVPTKKTVNRS